MRPQHGGLLGSIGSETGSDPLSDESLDDLGWNDMGDEPLPAQSHEPIKLTPFPVNEVTAAEARELDEQSGATLAEFSVSSSPLGSGDAREQQEVLAKRIERKSPPILSDAIMSNDDEPEDELADDSEALEANYPALTCAEYKAEDDFRLDDGEYGDGDQAPDERHPVDLTAAIPEVYETPQITAVKVPRAVRTRRVAAVDQGKRAAFTLRLDPERHLKLRLASTIGGRSAQQIVTDALDAYLGDMPELATLAAQVTRPGTENS